MTSLAELAERHRTAWTRLIHGRQEWIEGTLELAQVIFEEKKLLPDNNKFSDWLKQNGLAKINKGDRAALIIFAKHPKEARKVLEETRRHSYEWIQRQELKICHVPHTQNMAKSKGGGENRDRRRARRYAEILDNAAAGTAEQKPESGKARMTRLRREQKAPNLKIIPREQIDAELYAKDPIGFIAKYGHANIQTREEVEWNARHEALQNYLGLIEAASRAAQIVTSTNGPDPLAFEEWLAKPRKKEKFLDWLRTFEAVLEALRLHIGVLTQ
jgi:hypothetical protein